MAALLCLVVPLALVEDVRLVSGGRREVLSLSQAAGHRSQEVVSVLCSDKT